VGEHGTGLAVGALRERRLVPEQEQLLTGAGVAQAAAQRVAAVGDDAFDRPSVRAGAYVVEQVGGQCVDPEAGRRRGHGPRLSGRAPSRWRESDLTLEPRPWLRELTA
jgi:hypothetical protein